MRLRVSWRVPSSICPGRMESVVIVDPLAILLVVFGAAVGLGVLWNVAPEKTDDALEGCIFALFSIFWLIGSLLAFSVTAVIAALAWFGWWGLLSIPAVCGMYRLIWWLLGRYGFDKTPQK